MITPEDLAVETVVLERLKLFVEQYTTLRNLDQQNALDAQAYLDYTTKSLVQRLSVSLLGERLRPVTETKTVYVPANWWEHLKQTLFPRRPIKTRKIELKVEFDVVRVYPDIQQVHSQFGRSFAHVVPKVMQ